MDNDPAKSTEAPANAEYLRLNALQSKRRKSAKDYFNAPVLQKSSVGVISAFQQQ